MTARRLRYLLCLLVTAPQALGQLPPSATLSKSDAPLFHAEVDRVEALLKSTADPNAVAYALARTWASARQWPETLQWLHKAVDSGCGLDPSRDSLFTNIRATREFQSILDAVRAATPPISSSTRAFEIAEGDLAPESIAWRSEEHTSELQSR